MKDGVILEDNPQMTNCAADYGRRCQSIGMKRRDPKSLDNAMAHPKFNERHHALLDELEREYLASLPLTERGPWMTVQGGAYKDRPAVAVMFGLGEHAIHLFMSPRQARGLGEILRETAGEVETAAPTEKN